MRRWGVLSLQRVEGDEAISFAAKSASLHSQ
jgi:hypothetical protein